MCNGVCHNFEHRINEKNYYCQKCSRFIPSSKLSKEKKTLGRLRCDCCHGLVRCKSRIYRTNFMPSSSLSIHQPNS